MVASLTTARPWIWGHSARSNASRAASGASWCPSQYARNAAASWVVTWTAPRRSVATRTCVTYSTRSRSTVLPSFKDRHRRSTRPVTSTSSPGRQLSTKSAVKRAVMVRPAPVLAAASASWASVELPPPPPPPRKTEDLDSSVGHDPSTDPSSPGRDWSRTSWRSA